MIIEQIDVTYSLEAEPDQQDMIERVHEMHAEHCPVAESISPCIDINTSFQLESR